MYGIQQLPHAAGAGPGSGSGAGAGISVELVNTQLWEQFHAAKTEMIVTKTGRKLFPKLDINVCGLDPRRTYGIHLRLQRADDKKYRYTSSTWSASNDDDDACFPRTPPIESNEGFAQLGEVWMAKSIEFTNFKITNNLEESRGGMILVQTLHKYVPVIYIYDLTTGIPHANLASGIVKQEVLHLAEFITVTAYQSEAIKTLKTEHNPFAKGCRGTAAKQQQQNEELQQPQQQRRKRSYSPTSNPALMGHRSSDGAPSSKLASPAFPNMASMMPSPSYALPTVPQQQQPPSNPFPSPPQETRASPATVPQQQQHHHFQFPPPPSFPGFDPNFNPMMMMQPFPFAYFPGLAAPPMEYGSMQQMMQQQQYLPAPYTPHNNQSEPDSSSSNGNSPANSSCYGQQPYTPMNFQAMGPMMFQTPDATTVLPEVQDDDSASDSDEDEQQIANL